MPFSGTDLSIKYVIPKNELNLIFISGNCFSKIPLNAHISPSSANLNILLLSLLNLQNIFYFKHISVFTF